jgi:hypothetical protein
VLGIPKWWVELLAEKPTCPTKRNPLSPCVRTCIVNSVPPGNCVFIMASSQQSFDAQKANREQRIRELLAQLEQEKAEAEAAAAAEAKAAVEAEAEAEAEAEKQRQEVERKAKAEADAKQAEADAIRKQEEANKKARVAIRRGK